MKANSIRKTAARVSVVIAFLAGGIVSSADEFFKDAWYYREQAEEAKDRAVDAREKLDKAAERKAIDEQMAALGEYVKQSPSDTDMLEDYAMLLAGNVRDAAAIELACISFEKVAEQDPERAEARKKLAALLILPTVHRYNDAVAQLEAVIKQTPGDSEAMVLLGRCQIAMSRSEKAVATLERAIDVAPDEVDAYYFLAIALRFKLNRPAEADEWIDKMVAANPESATAHRYVCNYLLSLKTDNPNPKLARLHAEEALRLDPENSELLFFAAQASLVAADFEAARQYAEAGLEREKDSSAIRERMYLILTDAALKTKNVAKGREVLEKAFGELGNPQFLWLAGDVQCDLRDLTAAAASLDKLASLKFPAGGLDYLRGRISLLKGDWYEARKALEKAAPAFADKPDMLKRIECWLGACYGQLGDADRQIAAFRQALEIDPKFEPARKALGESLKVLARQKQVGEAIGLVEESWKNCEPEALAAACFSVSERGRDSEDVAGRTVEVLRAARKVFDDHPSLALALGNVYVLQHKYAEAEQCFRDALAKKPNDAVAMNNLAMVLVMAKKELSEALELMDKAIKIAGPLGQMLDTRACVYIAQGEAQKALDDLEKALADARTAERLFHQAEAFELAGKKDLAARAMKEALDKGLDVKTLPPGDIPVFERLKKLAEESPSL
jgi:cellulose synthase operon protein C